MSRVDELQKKYPNLPREVVVKWDALSLGIRDSEDLDKRSDWAPALGTYQSYDHDESLKEMAGKKSEGSRPGYIKRPPAAFFFKSAMGVALQRDSHSPYQVKETAPGQYSLVEGEEKVEDIYFLHPPKQKEELVTSKGTPVSSLINARRICFGVAPVRHCEYFPLGEQCKFCNYNAGQEDARALGLHRVVTIDLDETIEAYKILSSNVTLVEGRFEMGGFRKSESEAKIYLDFVGRIAGGAPYTPVLTLHTQPMGRKDMQRLKDAGLACVSFQMEVWDRDLFTEVCPGKSKYTGYDRYKEAFLEAVDVFGGGNVTSVFVGGVTLMPENGHKTWQEARDSFVDGIRWSIANGMLPIFLNLRLGPGSVYGDDKSNWQKLPPTEYYLDAIVAHHEAMVEHGLYEKLNKLMICPMDCVNTVYGGDVGILEIGGSFGNWLADAIPEETNWMARFVSSLRSTRQ